jgi:hypothetical protein
MPDMHASIRMPGRVRNQAGLLAAVPSTWMNFVGVSALPADR